jgi:hypothetical protein
MDQHALLQGQRMCAIGQMSWLHHLSLAYRQDQCHAEVWWNGFWGGLPVLWKTGMGS